MSKARKRRGTRPRSRRTYYAVAGLAVAIIVIVAAVALVTRETPSGAPSSGTSASTTSSTAQTQTTKPIILYINQGNGVVNLTNFGQLLSFSASHGFNTLFFQVYREGVLLFTPADLTTFVSEAHSEGLKIFFCLYITSSTQQIPTSIYPLGEDGISLDMSALPLSSQQSLYSTLAGGYNGTTAITTDDMTLPLTPDLLVLETYGSQYQQYIHSGIIASVEAVAETSQANYQQQFQYALSNSDGVMVFDYAGLLKTGY